MLDHLNLINNGLASLIAKDNILQIAMDYAITQKGKRIRPLVLLYLLEGFKVEVEKYLDIALALEVLHISSLVHDDLPEVDNDDYRRGQLTVHKKFNHAIGLFTGDALINKTYQIIMNAKIDSDLKVKIADIFAKLYGEEGLLLGQVYDLQKMPAILVNRLKTANLLILPFMVTCLIVNIDNTEFIKIAAKLGQAFQLQDDIIDYNPLNDDYINKMGIDNAKEKMNELYQSVCESLKGIVNFDSKLIIELIEKVRNRIE